MEKRKTLAIRSSVLAVAAAFWAAPHVHAAQPVESETAVQLYGHLDLSVDDADKGLSGRTGAVGRLGWQPDVASNLSSFGVRGSHDLGDGLKAVFQIETQVQVAATPGPTSDAQVNSALGSRNSFLGLAGGFGAVKAGKTDAPYKLSTGRMDPFSATVGDYNSIMGNTGGDNRAEFDTRVSHAVWYESPKMGAFAFSALYAPGQNRSTDNTIKPSGEPMCAGGNDPTCNDGSFDNIGSIAGVYSSGPLYAIAGYEVHKNVNRTGDEGGAVPAGAVGIVDEHAAKVGVQYKLPSNTTLNAIFEKMTRNAPNAAFNERQRNGYWLALTQKVSVADDVNVGLAHAGKSPGTPGALQPDGTNAVGSGADNAATMLSVGYKHHWDKQTTWYVVYAQQKNQSAAHYDLGASGHGITTDCHDANSVCFAGAKVQAVSVGMTYNF